MLDPCTRCLQGEAAVLSSNAVLQLERDWPLGLRHRKRNHGEDRAAAAGHC